LTSNHGLAAVLEALTVGINRGELFDAPLHEFHIDSVPLLK